MDMLSALIEMPKPKKDVTEIEADILETFKECRQKPFQRQSAEKRMDKNHTRYGDIFAKAAVVPGVAPMPSSALPDADVISNLQYQLSMLAEKECETQKSGQWVDYRIIVETHTH